MAVVGPLDGIDPQAIHLIRDIADWKWHPGVYGFVDDYGVAEPRRVTRVELVEHHLCGPAARARREDGIEWLKGRLGVA